jgi:hypothetical protein
MDDRQGTMHHIPLYVEFIVTAARQVHEGWSARAILHPRDTVIQIDGSPCPSSLAQLKACLLGCAGSTIELMVQLAGSSSAEGVRVLRITRRIPRPTKNAEVSAGPFHQRSNTPL